MTDQTLNGDTPTTAEDSTAHELEGQQSDTGAQPTLGKVLRDARERSGLGLSDLAEVTHVRRVYLMALEEGNYRELPENVYARNFVRLYANAVGLEPNSVLERYTLERQQALGHSTLEQRLEHDRDTARRVSTASPSQRTGRQRRQPLTWLSGPWLPTLALVIIVVSLAVWGFNSLLANGGRPQPSETDPTTAAAAAPDDAEATAAPPAADEVLSDQPTQVRVSIVTDPPGASVTIDGFPVPGVTPLQDVPVTARAGRLVRAELDGFEPGELEADLRQDTELELPLTPLGSAEAGPLPGADGEGSLVISVTDTTWLEVYRSTARNEGERLVYTTAQPGTSYQFAPPLYVYTGNAAGVRLTLDGQDLGAMGSPGAVLGRAFPE